MTDYIMRKPLTKEVETKLPNYSDLTKTLLIGRGIKTIQEAETFFAPAYERDLHDPYLMKDMDKAVKRILKAIDKKEKIVIFSDYDADGVPGGAVLHDFFKKIGYINFSNYIPHRHLEGFGLNMGAIDEFEKDKVNLVITVDCGITDVEEADKLKKNKIDLIVTDHHVPLCHSRASGNPGLDIEDKMDHKYFSSEKSRDPDSLACAQSVFEVGSRSRLQPRVREDDKTREKKGVKQKVKKEGDLLPKAVAVLDAKREDCQYPNKNICGAGVAFKLVQALIKEKDFGLKNGWEKWLLDLVGIATVSDMVALTGENRALAYFGLKVLKKTPRPGLQKLFKRLKIDPENITEDDIGFSIAPRINAASRLGDPEDAFKMLVADSDIAGDQAAEVLEALNVERKSMVAILNKEVKVIVEERYSGENKKPVMVIGNPNWRPGILGLAANSLLDNHQGAVFLWGREGGEEGLLKGSCRSDGCVSVVELMKRVPKEILKDFGGHSVSGGFSISEKTVHKLEDSLCLAYAELSAEIIKPEPTVIDWALSPEEVNEKLWKDISKFAPFGMENKKPLFLIPQAKISQVKIFGKENNHLELTLESKGKKVVAISFFAQPDSWGGELKTGDVVDVIATLENSTFRGRNEIRLRIEDVLFKGII